MEELYGAEWRAQGQRDRSQAGRPPSGNRLWRNRLHPGQYPGKAAQPRAKPSTTPTPVDSGLHTEGLGQKQGVPSAESKISPVSTRAEFPGTSRLSTQRSSPFYRCFVTAAGADLMQLDDVAEGVSHKYLIGILSD